MTNHFIIFTLALKDYMLPCLSKRIFGMECPGCGLQRSIAFLVQGNFLEAFKMYPAIYTLIPLFIVIVVNKLVRFRYAQRMTIGLSIASVALILINYIVNLLN